jgi:hypothetical protein
MPPEQALTYVIEQALFSFGWLVELDIQWQLRTRDRRDASQIRKQQGIVRDAFSVYIASLFDMSKGTHSLLRSYVKNEFIEKFKQNPFVKSCIKHRNKRAGHQSKEYGFVIPLDVIINSDLDKWLNEAFYLVATKQMKKV